MTVTTLQAAPRPREYVAVTGPDAVSYLERMVSNEVATLELGEAREALLLTPKARIVAPLVVLRRADDELLLLTEPGLGEVVRATLLRMRLRARCEIALEDHRSTILLGAVDADRGIATADYGVPAVELLNVDPPERSVPVVGDELERLRIRAGTPRWGAELDERVLPAEAGLEARAISFTKGCYPGQEPVARLHYRGHPNRGLRVLAIEDGSLPERDATLLLEGKDVGRVTSAARDPGLGIVALAYVRREVAQEAVLLLADGRHVVATDTLAGPIGG